MKKFKNICLLVVGSLLLLCGCSKLSTQPLTYTGTALDTVISIQIYDSSDEALLDHCVELCEQYEGQFSRTIETSEISLINNAGGNAVEVSEETIKLIKKGIYYGDL